MSNKFLILVFSFFIAASASAQFGVVAGLNYGSIDSSLDTDNEDIDSEIGFEVGAAYKHSFGNFDLITELTYASHKSSLLDNEDPLDVVSFDYTFSYINLRPLLAFKVHPSINLLAGVTIGYSLSKKAETNTGGEFDFDDDQFANFFDNSDFRIALNAGISFPITTGFGTIHPRLMYEYGLTNDVESINNAPDPDAELKISTIKLDVGIFF